MKIAKLIFILIILPLMLIWVGCTLEKPTETKTVLSLGSANFTSFVAIGNSLTAGVQSGSLVETHQEYSFPNLIAKQAGVDFAQPTVSYPGIPAIMELVALDPLTILTASGTGLPTNLYYQYPYNNLGIPGAILWDVLNTTDSTNSGYGQTGNKAFDLILRNADTATVKTTVFQQAQILQPTTITLWIGNNDVLGFATSGGYSPADPTPIQGVPGLSFNELYDALADSIASLGADVDVFVANIPDVTAIPFFTTIGPKMRPAVVGVMAFDTNAVGLVYQKHGETVPGTGVTTLDYENNQDTPLITLLGSAYADTSVFTKSTGKWYRDIAEDFGVPVGYVIPAGIDTTMPFGLHYLNPWPDALILDPDEIQTAATHIGGYNSHIRDVAISKGFHLVDVNTVFNDIAANGLSLAGQEFSADYISGGLFSLDGVHPSDIGHGVIANEFIAVINSAKNASIPLVDVFSLTKPAVSLSKIYYKDSEGLKNTIRMLGGSVY